MKAIEPAIEDESALFDVVSYDPIRRRSAILHLQGLDAERGRALLQVWRDQKEQANKAFDVTFWRPFVILIVSFALAIPFFRYLALEVVLSLTFGSVAVLLFLRGRANYRQQEIQRRFHSALCRLHSAAVIEYVLDFHYHPYMKYRTPHAMEDYLQIAYENAAEVLAAEEPIDLSPEILALLEKRVEGLGKNRRTPQEETFLNEATRWLAEPRRLADNPHRDPLTGHP